MRVTCRAGKRFLSELPVFESLRKRSFTNKKIANCEIVNKRKSTVLKLTINNKKKQICFKIMWLWMICRLKTPYNLQTINISFMFFYVFSCVFKFVQLLFHEIIVNGSLTAPLTISEIYSIIAVTKIDIINER